MKLLYAAHVILEAVAWTWVKKSVLAVSSRISVAPSMNSTCSDWTAWTPPRTEPAIILQVVTEEYIPFEKNFIALMESNSNFSRENIYLLCLDTKSEREIAQMGFGCVPVADTWDDNLGFVWKLRVRVLSCLVKAGHSVILSDNDALWLKDPMLDIDVPEVRGSSIVASRGSFPDSVGSVWGSTLCMGFIFFHADKGVDIIVTNMERLVMKIGDDQEAINFTLNNLGIDWDTSSDMRYIFSTNYGKGIMSNLGEGVLKVTLLPHDQYTRRCDKVPIGSNTTVAHCLSGKHGLSKIGWMKRCKLWVVEDPPTLGQQDVHVAQQAEGNNGG